MVECKYEVTPFPYEFCQGCVLNGCYPWNRNPLLLCGAMGGMHPTIVVDVSCLSCKPVDDEMWIAHLNDLKREAAFNEEAREKAVKGKVCSSDLLPAEYIAEKMKGEKKRED